MTYRQGLEIFTIFTIQGSTYYRAARKPRVPVPTYAVMFFVLRM